MGPSQVGAQHSLPVVGLHPHSEAITGDGSVVHQDVELAEALERLLEAGLPPLGVGHVHGHSQGFATRRGDLRDYGGQFLDVARRRGHLGPGAGQGKRGRAADALRGPGHQCHSVLQAEHGVLGALLGAGYVSATSACAWASLSRVLSRLFSSSTLKQCTDRSICRSRPLSTRAGPTSTKMLTPSSINACMDSSQRTGRDTWRTRASRASSPLEINSASTLVTSGTRSGANAVRRRSLASFSWAGIISSQGNGAETASTTARLAPLAEASSTARFTAPA